VIVARYNANKLTYVVCCLFTWVKVIILCFLGGKIAENSNHSKENCREQFSSLVPVLLKLDVQYIIDVKL
jgi:hypothetical protein